MVGNFRHRLARSICTMTSYLPCAGIYMICPSRSKEIQLGEWTSLSTDLRSVAAEHGSSRATGPGAASRDLSTGDRRGLVESLESVLHGMRGAVWLSRVFAEKKQRNFQTFWGKWMGMDWRTIICVYCHLRMEMSGSWHTTSLRSLQTDDLLYLFSHLIPITGLASNSVRDSAPTLLP